MVTVVKTVKMIGNKSLVNSACLSTDTKPTANMVNGSLMLEMDTGDIYAFNEASTTWIKVA